ncbi:MAG TPA: carboxypeptidase-like regulatory domain-containing protein [Bryobacteraceae bacterium]|nr:carboxypeptidase-like regulatory domain-containing protein [Bryobacteraceae bacterium]
MRIALLFAFAALAYAAVDGTVTNSSTGKPQAGATVTLFQPTNQGPQFIDSVKTDAQGHFQITKEVPAGGAGPLLLQAVYAGVQYNKMLPPGTPTSGVEIPVFESSKRPGDAKVDQHMILLEPAASGTLQVSESYVFKNDGKTTWNDPDNGTLQFELPAGAQGKVEVNALAPGGLPIRKAPDPGPRPNTFKLDFPIKPGESRVDLQWSMPFNTPGVFEERVLTKGGLTRVVAPVGVTFKGADLKDLGQEPRTKATVFSTNGPDIKFDVQGTGALNDGATDASASGGGDGAASGQPALSMNLPKLYNLTNGSADIITTMLAVKWVLLSVLGMLAVGFTLLYRKGNPIDADQKASKNAGGRS